MSKEETTENKETIYLDIKGAISKFNDSHPDGLLNQKKLSEKLGMTTMTLQNLQKGKVPVIFCQVKKMMDILGLEFKDIVKTK